jgi:hypothetical protein
MRSPNGSTKTAVTGPRSGVCVQEAESTSSETAVARAADLGISLSLRNRIA